MTMKSTVTRVISEVETRGQIAQRIGVPPGTVDQWIHRYGGKGFPEPIGEIGGTAIYWQPEVDQWLESTGRA